jgi:hypothetical protein
MGAHSTPFVTHPNRPIANPTAFAKVSFIEKFPIGVRPRKPKNDKDCFLGGLNIEKREFCVKGFLSQRLESVWV